MNWYFGALWFKVMTKSTGLTFGAVAFVVMKAFLFFVCGGDDFGGDLFSFFLFGFFFNFVSFEIN